MMVSYAERMPKRKARSRSRRKRKPPVEPDKMTITLSDIGQRTVAVERMVPKREQVHRQLSSVEEEGEGTDDGDKKSHNMSTQTTLHDLEFLITDPLIQEAPGRGRARLPREVVYTRQTTAQRTYKTGRTTVNVEHQSVDNIVVHIDKSILANPTGRTDRSDGLQHKEDERKDKNHEQNPPDVEEADRKSVKKNRITFTEDVTPTEERKKSETTRETPCVSKVRCCYGVCRVLIQKIKIMSISNDNIESISTLIWCCCMCVLSLFYFWIRRYMIT